MPKHLQTIKHAREMQGRDTIEVVEVNAEVVEVNTEVVEFNTEVVEVNTEVVEVNTEVVKVNTEVVEVNIEVVKVNTEVVKVNTEVVEQIIIGTNLVIKVKMLFKKNISKVLEVSKTVIRMYVYTYMYIRTRMYVYTYVYTYVCIYIVYRSPSLAPLSWDLLLHRAAAAGDVQGIHHFLYQAIISKK